MNNKEYGRQVAKRVTENTGIKTTFIERCDKGFHFQTEQYKTYKQIDMNGNETPSRITNKWEAPSEIIYGLVTCFPEQCENGDLDFFVTSGYSQDLNFTN